MPANRLRSRSNSALPACRSTLSYSADYAMMRPGEVDTPELAITAANFVLQLGQGHAVVDHHQTRFAFHRRLGSAVRVLQQLSYCDDAATPRLFAHSAFQLFTVQRFVRIAASRAANARGRCELPCHLDRSPCRCCGQSPGNALQWRAVPLMNRQAQRPGAFARRDRAREARSCSRDRNRTTLRLCPCRRRRVVP